jgi:integrase
MRQGGSEIAWQGFSQPVLALPVRPDQDRYHVLPILAVHMREWAGTDRVFIGRDGKPMRGDAVRQAFTRARRKADMPGFRFHDLRHTGQTLPPPLARPSKT